MLPPAANTAASEAHSARLKAFLFIINLPLFILSIIIAKESAAVKYKPAQKLHNTPVIYPFGVMACSLERIWQLKRARWQATG
jgi:hypothetical protein